MKAAAARSQVNTALAPYIKEGTEVTRGQFNRWAKALGYATVYNEGQIIEISALGQLVMGGATVEDATDTVRQNIAEGLPPASAREPVPPTDLSQTGNVLRDRLRQNTQQVANQIQDLRAARQTVVETASVAIADLLDPDRMILEIATGTAKVYQSRAAIAPAPLSIFQHGETDEDSGIVEDLVLTIDPPTPSRLMLSAAMDEFFSMGALPEGQEQQQALAPAGAVEHSRVLEGEVM